MSARTALVTGDSGSFSRARRRTGPNPNRTSAPRKKTNTQARPYHPPRNQPPQKPTPKRPLNRAPQHPSRFAKFDACSPVSPVCKSIARLRLRAEDIAAIQQRWGIELFPKAATAPSEDEARSITGHIDFLQIRNGAIHILDYKPDATTGKPFAQLTLYALGALAPDRHPALRFQVRIVQRAPVLRICPAHRPRAQKHALSAATRGERCA